METVGLGSDRAGKVSRKDGRAGYWPDENTKRQRQTLPLHSPARIGQRGRSLRDRRFAERRYSVFCFVEYLEDSEQLCDLQQIDDATVQRGELHRATVCAGRRVESDQRSQAPAIDIADALKVDHDLFLVRGQLVLHRISQLVGFI